MRTLFSLFIILMISSITFGQTPKIDVNAKLPIDKNVKIGKLDNGLTYYIRKNSKPEKRVEMRLVVNAGSLYEDDNQQGLAHFVEHMCFNGTKNFPKNELINFLEKMGIKFGGDLNAYTSFAETVYMLFLPTDNEELYEKGYQVLEDWAHNVSFEDKEIDKERGVIIEEWRLGLGANDRMRKKSFPVIFKDSRYADRVPIGKKEILEKFKYETLKSFYKDWYRPDLMAVIIVGDIDVNIAEEKVKKYFSNLKNPENPKARIEYDLPDNIEPLISIETDKEATNNMAMFFIKHPHKIVENGHDYRESIMAELYNGMLNDRLNEFSKNPECPYTMAYTGYGEFLARSNDAYTSYAVLKENKITEGFEFLLNESLRVKQHGFTQTELDRQKEKILSDYERAAKEVEKTMSSSFAEQYVSHFLSKLPIVGAPYELKLVRGLLPGIELADINQLAKNWITDKNQVVMIQAPQKPGLIVPTKTEILEVFNKVKNKTMEPYLDKVSSSPLVETIPQGSKTKSKKVNEEFGFTELILENGVRVVLKPTDFKNDEILFSAYSLGGTSLYPDKDIMSATFATQIIDETGLGNLDNIELQKKLTGKLIQISPTLDELKEGFRGNCSPKDIETMLQLIYLYFTQPRQDTTAFQAFLSNTRNQLKFYSGNPQVAFYDTLMKVSSSNSPRTIGILNENRLGEIDLKRVYEIYRDRFADASDFTFLFIGNFNVDEISPMLETYLGGLPSINRKEIWKNVDPEFPAGIKQVKFKKGIAPQSNVAILISDKFEYNYQENLNLYMAIQILNIKLREALREDQGGVYGVQAMHQTEQFPEPKYQIFVTFGCSPKNVKKLTKTVFAEMEKIRLYGPTDDDMNKIRETMIRERETQSKENKFWLAKLESHYYNNDDLKNITNYNENINKVTNADIQKSATKYFTTKKFVSVVLFPEKKTKEKESK